MCACVCTYVDVCACGHVAMLVYMWVCVCTCVCVHLAVCACARVCQAGWGGNSKQRKPNVQLLGGEGPVSGATKAGRPGWRAATGRRDGCWPQTRPLNAQVCSLLSVPDGRPLPGLWGTDVRLTLPLTFASLAPTHVVLGLCHQASKIPTLEAAGFPPLPTSKFLDPCPYSLSFLLTKWVFFSTSPLPCTHEANGTQHTHSSPAHTQSTLTYTAHLHTRIILSSDFCPGLLAQRLHSPPAK